MKNIKILERFKGGLLKTKVVILTAIMCFALVAVVGIDSVNNNSSTSSMDKNIQVFGSVYKTQYGVTTASSLNVRSGSGAKYSSVANMKKGTKVIMIGKINNFYKITYGGKTRYISAQYVKITAKPSTIVVAPKPKLLIDRIKNKGNAKQAIVVTTSSYSSINATITTFENVNGKWRQVASFIGSVGYKGFIYNKVEGDGHSPIGVFSLGTAFGRYSNPGTSMTYRKSSANDFWVDDIKSPLYNTWQKGPVNGRWKSAEKMYIPLYNYGFVINYNTAKRVPGKGSGIFFHVWTGAGHGTAGCTATAQANVINILKWLKPSKSPIIIEGPISEVLKM